MAFKKGRSHQQFREQLLADMKVGGYSEREIEVVEEALGMYLVFYGLTYALGQGFSSAQKRTPKKREPKTLSSQDVDGDMERRLANQEQQHLEDRQHSGMSGEYVADIPGQE